jgi:L-galactose dehydrogenase
MKYRKLGKTGLDVSVLSFGASSLGSVFREINEDEGFRTVHTSVDRGVNLIDVSPYYGLTKAETVLGKAIKQIPRDQFILSSKAGRYGENQFDYSEKRIIQSVEESLNRLNTDYLDILFLHDMEFVSFEQVIQEGIPALRKLKEQGKIRFFGVSGLPLTIFEKTLAEVELDAVLSYCHYSLNDMSLLESLPLFEQHQVGLINASPLSMGLLNGRRPPKWHPASQELINACQQASEHCKRKGKDIAQLAIQFSVRHESIPTTLVSTATPANMIKNIEWSEELLDEGLLQEVLDILKPVHNQTWQSGRSEYN